MRGYHSQQETEKSSGTVGSRGEWHKVVPDGVREQVWESTKPRDTSDCAEGKAPLFAEDHSLVRVVPVA